MTVTAMWIGHRIWQGWCHTGQGCWSPKWFMPSNNLHSPPITNRPTSLALTLSGPYMHELAPHAVLPLVCSQDCKPAELVCCQHDVRVPLCLSRDASSSVCLALPHKPRVSVKPTGAMPFALPHSGPLTVSGGIEQVCWQPDGKRVTLALKWP